MELPAKLLDYFLRSDKSNINQILCEGAFLWMLRELNGIVGAPLWMHRETSWILISGEEPGVLRDCVGVCMCVRGMQASTYLAAGSYQSAHLLHPRVLITIPDVLRDSGMREREWGGYATPRLFSCWCSQMNLLETPLSDKRLSAQLLPPPPLENDTNPFTKDYRFVPGF